jgi:peptidoglycan/LPS O-acetylase OafA/YrhL
MSSEAPPKPNRSFDLEGAKAEAPVAAPPPKPKKKSKPRIDALEGVRFCLIAYIASGHFIFTATSDPFYLKLIGQINVVVGAFFVISGYVAAYTTTELGERKYTPARLDNAVNFTVSRIMGFWPLHFLVLVLFSPMFIYADYAFSGPLVASWHGFISTFLLSAWFPLSAEVWNAPTWFLSAMSFSFIPLPYALKAIAGQSKRELMRSLTILTVCSLLPKLAYSYDLQAWTIFEGDLNKKTHPNYALFNSLRFSPLNALLEILMGAVACRLVMLDTPEETGKTSGSVWPFMGMVGLIVLRAADLIQINDLLVRTAIFIPMFIWFLMALHRETVGPEGTFKPIVKFMNLRIMQWLGSISFPIFIWHGPVGQLFYKKVIAKQVWGASLATILPGHFAIWWLVIIILSWMSMKFFVNTDKVKTGTKRMSAQLEKPLVSPAPDPATSPVGGA